MPLSADGRARERVGAFALSREAPVGGSNSGIGADMSFWAGNVGTKTSGSILSPASGNMLAAVKPTLGSREAIQVLTDLGAVVVDPAHIPSLMAPTRLIWRLDALLIPSSSGAGIAAKPGSPTVIVPYARVIDSCDPPLPAGVEPLGRPCENDAAVSRENCTCADRRPRWGV